MVVPDAITWHRVHQGDLLPAPRASHSMNFVNGYLIVYGGGGYGGRHLDDSWVSAIPENPTEGIAWKQEYGGAPPGRFGQSCCVVGKSFVLFGGIDDKGTRLGDTWISHELEGSVEEPTWQLLEVAAAPPPRGAHAGCFAGDRRAVIFGGITSDGTRVNDTWVLDLADLPHCWKEVVTQIAPQPRSGHTLTWLGGKQMILFGGRGVDFEVMNDLWLLDFEPEFPTWMELQAPVPHSGNACPAPRAGHSATLIFGERILIFGGEDSRSTRKGDVWVLDPRTKIKASQSTPLLPSLSSHGTVEELSTTQYSHRVWKRLKQWGRRPIRRSFHAACAVEARNVVMIFGGMVDGELKPGAAEGLGFDAELFMIQFVLSVFAE